MMCIVSVLDSTDLADLNKLNKDVSYFSELKNIDGRLTESSA